MRVGEALVHLLADYGVERVFGIPGTHNLELYRGLSAEPRIDHVLAHHEQGAGFMADGYARSSGKPGVCFVITGPGVTNITTAIGTAYADSIPLLVISSIHQPDPDHREGRLHEIIDQVALTGPLTAFSQAAQYPDEIPELLAKAFSIFSSERPRPVHIHIPLPMLAEETDPWSTRDLPAPPLAPESAIRAAVNLLSAAQRPLLIIGGGTRSCADAVRELVDRLGVPVISSTAARGVIPGSHPLHPGGQLGARPIQELLGDADLLLLLGTELAHSDHYTDDLKLPSVQIWVNLDPWPDKGNGEDILIIRGEAGVFCRALTALLPPATAERSERSKAICVRTRELLADALIDQYRDLWTLIMVIDRSIPEDTLIFSDMTTLAYVAIDHLPLDRPGSWFHPSGFGPLGFAVPAAMGGCIAFPDRPVLAIVGDAGIQYTLQEMVLATEKGLDLTVLLWDNEGLRQIRLDMEAADIVPIAVNQQDPDFAKLAQAIDWGYRRPADLDEVADALRQGLMGGAGPNLIHLVEGKLFPKVTGRLTEEVSG